MGPYTWKGGGEDAHLEIHLSAQSAFFLTQGMVSTARKRWSFSTGSLMYVSSRRLYISAVEGARSGSAHSTWGCDDGTDVKDGADEGGQVNVK